jgi:hypothetical protein
MVRRSVVWMGGHQLAAGVHCCRRCHSKRLQPLPPHSCRPPAAAPATTPATARCFPLPARLPARPAPAHLLHGHAGQAGHVEAAQKVHGVLVHLDGLGVDGRLIGDEVHAALALLLLQQAQQGTAGHSTGRGGSKDVSEGLGAETCGLRCGAAPAIGGGGGMPPADCVACRDSCARRRLHCSHAATASAEGILLPGAALVRRHRPRGGCQLAALGAATHADSRMCCIRAVCWLHIGL